MAACGAQDSGAEVDAPKLNEDTRTHSASGGSWTVLVYMVADNNLEGDALKDLREMAAVGSNAGLNIVVQIDRAAEYTGENARNLGDFVTAKRLLVEKGNLKELDDLGELNMGDQEVLSDFIGWGLSNYPADRYALIFWDHGAGWPGFGGDESTSDQDMLDLTELKAGIAAGMEAGGVKQFALLGFDACLMATFEAAMSLRSFGEYLLASQELEPGHGWDYRALMLLRDAPGSNPKKLGEVLIDGFKAQAQAENTSGDITLSLTDLYALTPLFNAVSELATSLGQDLGSSAVEIAVQVRETLAFAKTEDPAQDRHIVDLGDLATRLGAAVPKVSGVKALTSALSAAVVDSTAGPVSSAANGLSIYFPPLPDRYDAGYDQLEDVAVWRDFLKDFYQAGQSTPAGETPVFTSANHLAEANWSNTTLTVTGQLKEGTAANVVETVLRPGVIDPDSGKIYLLGKKPAQVDDHGLVEGSWNSRVLYLAQGQNSAYAYLALSVSGDYQVASIPVALMPPGATDLSEALNVFIRLILDSDGETLESAFFIQTEGGVSELTPEEGSELFPLLLVVGGDGNLTWETTTDQSFDPSQPLDFGLEPLPTGVTVYAELDVTDVAGRGDYVYYTGKLGETECTPDCQDKECGDNGCGGSCGSCSDDQTCDAGECSAGQDDPCETCLNQNCASEISDCEGSQVCVDLIGCLYSCSDGDDDCISTCVADYDEGYDGAMAFLTCQDDNCSDECY